MIKILSSVLILSTILSGCSQAHIEQGADASTQSQISYAFTKANQHPEKMLENVIDSSHKTLNIAAYSLTKQDIIDSIINAKNRGVNVRIITDRIEARNKSQVKAISELESAGIPVKENHHSGLMHLKVTIADNQSVTTGSFNYTEAASKTNDEVFVVIHDSKIASDWEQQFTRMWNDNKGFEDVH